MVASPPMPANANRLFVSVEQIGGEINGTVTLAHLRGQPIGSPNRRVFKVLATPNQDLIYPAPIKDLKAIQQDPSHLCAYIYECDENEEWYTMEHVRGCNVARLLGHYHNAQLPPWLVFDILTPLIRGLLHLQEKGLCHIELEDGDNVMVHNSASTSLFQVKLIGFEGVAVYDRSQDITVLEQVMALAKLMTGGKKKVADVYRRGSGGEPFGEKALEEAEHFYKLIAGKRYLGKFRYRTLRELWNALSPQMVSVSAALKDDAMEEELRTILAMEVVGHYQIESAITRDRMDTANN
ncbi:hypothetical protein CC86DRAFT_51200 [Ophiobolus disseminans]|uniref:Protein kinase domain-containing protein n=1 Tax=Ophiobolus disseminans TaxID=1469910 RepID=A0A6A6ZSW5_9PLEO|nr:hypothetical protein CC86DRAFT_51200 [Ophiobolus disseminans]